MLQTPLQKALQKIKTSTQPLNIDLTGYNIGESGAIAIAKALKFATVLLNINLCNNNIGNDGAIAIAKALKVVKVPLTINLEHNNIGNKYYNTQTRGVIAIAGALKVIKVPLTINLNYNSIRDKGAIEIAKALKFAIVPLNIRLEGNLIEDKGAIAIAKTLESATVPLNINLNYNSIRDEGSIAIAKALKCATLPLNINLCNNHIGDNGAIAVADALKVITVPLTINLACNFIGDNGAIAIAKALKFATVLLNINLESNHIKSTGVITISDALKVAKIPLNINLKFGFYYNTAQSAFQTLSNIQKDNIAIDSYKDPKLFNERLGKLVIFTFKTLPVLTNLDYIQWVDGIHCIDNNVAQIISLFLGQEEIALINMKAIHVHAASNVIVDNKFYSLHYNKLGLSVKDNQSLYQWLLYIVSKPFSYIDQLTASYFSMSLNKKVKMDKVAQKYNYRIDTSDLNTKKTFLKLAKVIHPDKEGNSKAFIEIADIYYEDVPTSSKEFTQYHIDGLKGINMGTQIINTIINVAQIKCNPNTDNTDIVIELIKDGLLLTGIWTDTPLLTLAIGIEGGYTIYKMSWVDSIKTISFSISSMIAVNLMFGVCAPTFALSAGIVLNALIISFNAYNAVHECFYNGDVKLDSDFQMQDDLSLTCPNNDFAGDVMILEHNDICI